jgi:hypothetical protein
MEISTRNCACVELVFRYTGIAFESANSKLLVTNYDGWRGGICEFVFWVE